MVKPLILGEKKKKNQSVPVRGKKCKNVVTLPEAIQLMRGVIENDSIN